MPGFVKTPKDEAKWSKAKAAASKSTKEGSESYWKLANYIFHKGEDMEKAEGILSPPGAPKVGSGTTPGSAATAVKSPGKTGEISVKMPKAKKLADGFGKPSLFFKSEDFNDVKHPTICKLRDFLKSTRSKRQSSR